MDMRGEETQDMGNTGLTLLPPPKRCTPSGGGGTLWRPQGTRRQDRRPPGRRPFRDQRRSGELASPQVSPHLFLFSLISSPVFLSLGFPRVWCPVLFVKPPSSMCSFNKGLLSVLLVSSLLRVRAPRALWHTRYGLEIFFFCPSSSTKLVALF